jgi:hypothetical protein
MLSTFSDNVILEVLANGQCWLDGYGSRELVGSIELHAGYWVFLDVTGESFAGSLRDNVVRHVLDQFTYDDFGG